MPRSHLLPFTRADVLRMKSRLMAFAAIGVALALAAACGSEEQPESHLVIEHPTPDQRSVTQPHVAPNAP